MVRAPAAGEWVPRSLEIGTQAASVRAGRHFVREQVGQLGSSAVLDEVDVTVAELLTNAVQHGAPPVVVTVDGDAGCVRVEIADANPRPPVRPIPSSSNLTGRGIRLVEAFATRWGVEARPDGKVVWAEFEPQAASPSGSADVEALVEAWSDDTDDVVRAGLHTVVLGDVPTELLIAAKAHIDNIVRELSLAAGSDDGVPEHLASLIRRVVHGFADPRDAIKRQALASAARGDRLTRLTLRLPLSAAAAGVAYLAGLDEADSYARAARLLTMEAPPAHRLFRRWYVESVIAQLQAAADGQEPPPAVPFEQRMLEEIGRLATLQRITDRAARLQRVTAALATARTPEDVASVVVSEGVAALEAFGGSLLVPADDGEHMAVPGVVGYRKELIDALREERLDAPLPAATVMRTGVPVWLESRAERDALYPALRGFEASTVSMCAVPLLVGHRTLGALRFSFARRRLFDTDERAFVLALAAVTAQTLARTETYAAERRASLELQRALLPADIPDVVGWDLAAFYSPAGGQEAGGDFYDVLPLPDGRVIAVVGDVMGRGVEAAAAMAQVRTMIRSYAVLDPDPGAVFRHVDAYFDVYDLSQLVTVLYFLLDPATGVVTVGNAGHVPPVVYTSDHARAVATDIGTPFGAGAFGRSATQFTLEPGESLVAVTDGLVERRGEDIDEGLVRLTDASLCPDGCGAQELVTRIVVAASTGVADSDDDSTVLVLRRLGLPGHPRGEEHRAHR